MRMRIRGGEAVGGGSQGHLFMGGSVRAWRRRRRVARGGAAVTASAVATAGVSGAAGSVTDIGTAVTAVTKGQDQFQDLVAAAEQRLPQNLA